MRLKTLLTQIFVLIFLASASCQTLSKNDIQFLQSTIGVFLLNHETLNGHKRPSEFIICLISLDTEGKVNKVHLLADDKNRDSTYYYLSYITPSVFENWNARYCKNKTIVMPIISFGEGDTPKYIAAILSLYPIKEISIESETNDIIVVSPMRYNSPVERN